MSWETIQDDRDRLLAALHAFEWDTVSQMCDALAERVYALHEGPPPSHAKAILSDLRRKRRFQEMQILAEAFLWAGSTDPEIRRQWAQALIDDGRLNQGQRKLEEIANNPATVLREQMEARGLLGRTYKQAYVNSATSTKETLAKAIEYYLGVYETDPGKYLWHGINVVALLARAGRDSVPLPAAVVRDYRQIAASILTQLKAIEEDSGSLGYWDRATAMEAKIALKRYEDALDDVREYIRDPRVDAFECKSTLRQLEEVWQLGADGPVATVLAYLRSAVLQREGGQLELGRSDLQKNFSAEDDLPLRWWQTALDRCKAVARIESLQEKKVGTGFLVRMRDFLDTPNDSLALLTNWHVVSESAEFAGSLAPQNASALFEATGERFQITEIVAHSRNLDATLATLAGTPHGVQHCPLDPPCQAFSEARRQRLYTIGYPGGRGLSFSLHDSLWLDDDGTWLHYRTPTEQGSSGSPVFDDANWTLVGLHHAGSKEMKRLKGQPGTYQANEAIAVAAIRSRFSQSLKS